MDAAEYKAALDRLGYTAESFARVAGVDVRTAQKWAYGEARVAPLAVQLLRLLLARPELVKVLAELPPPEVRKREP